MVRYCYPIEVWDALNSEREGDRDKSETFSDVADGETVELSHKYLIGDAFLEEFNSELTKNQDVLVLDGSGNLQSTSDYEVDLRDGRVTWNGGTTISTLKVRYKTAPVPNSEVLAKIKAAEEEIDDKTNTTFGGTEFVNGEIYDGEGYRTTFYPLANRPVVHVHKVEVNDAQPGDTDDWIERDKGRANDYIVRSGIGVEFTDGDKGPRNEMANLRVNYEYGYEDVPDEIKGLCVAQTAMRLMQDQTLGEIIDGREDFEPDVQRMGFLSRQKEIFNRWRVERYDGVTTVASEGV